MPFYLAWLCKKGQCTKNFFWLLTHLSIVFAPYIKNLEMYFAMSICFEFWPLWSRCFSFCVVILTIVWAMDLLIKGQMLCHWCKVLRGTKYWKCLYLTLKDNSLEYLLNLLFNPSSKRMLFKKPLFHILNWTGQLRKCRVKCILIGSKFIFHL